MTIDIWAIVTTVLLILALGVSLVPFVPGPALVWAVVIVYALATDLQVIGVGHVIIITLLMIMGSTADWWTRYMGLNAEGSMSCGTFFVSIIGGIAGTFLIPIPVFGTMLGAALAVAAMVYMDDNSSAKDALKAGRGIFLAWLSSFFVEFILSVAMVALFVRAAFFV